MNTSILAEILAWSADRPAWQRDALRRLISNGALQPEDVDDLFDLCKADRGLSPRRPATPLASSHIASAAACGAPVTLVELTHQRGVNALAEDQQVNFGSQLTVVYGPNAAGKSGYTRILKRACRARASENILGNVLSQGAPPTPEATIRYRLGDEECVTSWQGDKPENEDLGAVSIFDAQCAPVYLRDKTDVAFRPLGLDLFDKLSETCAELRKRLQAEIEALKATRNEIPAAPVGTKTHELLQGLSALTEAQDVRKLGALSEDEDRRLAELRQMERDFAAADPERAAQDLTLRASRLDALVKHLDTVGSVFGSRAIEQLNRSMSAMATARSAAQNEREAKISPDLLPGTGDDTWRKLWDSALEFSKVAFPGREVPNTSDDARCPFCQQPIEPDAQLRIRHLQEFVGSQAHALVEAAEADLREKTQRCDRAIVTKEELEPTIAELHGEDEQLEQAVRGYLDRAEEIRQAVKGAATRADVVAQLRGVEGSPVELLKERAGSLRSRAAALRTGDRALDPAVAQELKELEARALLRPSVESVVAEIDRLKRIAVFEQCLGDVATTGITKKSTELTKRAVTEKLQDRFGEELKRLEFKHVEVEIQAAGGSHGSLFHRIVFKRAPNVSVPAVLSEGESRALSLAAFLTELSTASDPSAIIFDDPVSSLDHVWRERIGRRLVDEARSRQTIVFTHDLFFVHVLTDASEIAGVSCDHQYVRRGQQGSGYCSADLPWFAMKVKDRIGRLKALWQDAEKTHRTVGPDAYEEEARTIFGYLREAWEQGVVEVLLDSTVERYRPSIETKRVRSLHDITEADCQAVDAGMSECSLWMRGHAEAAADGSPFPGPDDLKKAIADFEDWVSRIRKRRS